MNSLFLLSLLFLISAVAVASFQVPRHSRLPASRLSRALHLQAGAAGKGKVTEVSSLGQLDGILTANTGKLVVMDFFANWCGPCKMISPIYDKLASEGAHPNTVFLKVDVDTASDVTAKYAVSSMPTFVFLKNGAVVDRFAGASEKKLLDTINKHSN